jgi:hypothetical protein
VVGTLEVQSNTVTNAVLWEREADCTSFTAICWIGFGSSTHGMPNSIVSSCSYKFLFKVSLPMLITILSMPEIICNWILMFPCHATDCHFFVWKKYIAMRYGYYCSSSWHVFVCFPSNILLYHVHMIWRTLWVSLGKKRERGKTTADLSIIIILNLYFCAPNK